MAYYSEELVEEVRRKNDIVDVISSYVQLKKKGSTYFGLCPFHNEKTGSFSVSQSKQMFYCFGCGAGGNVFTFMQKIDSMSYPEAIKSLAQRVGVDLPVDNYSPAQKAMDDKRAKMRDMYLAAAQFYVKNLHAPEGQRTLAYFTGRGLTPDTITKFGLGSCPPKSNGLYQHLKNLGYSDREMSDAGLCRMNEQRGGYDYFFNRAMFPIMDDRSRVVAFGGRVMGDGDPKYLNTQEILIFDKSRVLYGMHAAKSSKREGNIICEGYMDVISLHQAGFDNAVACMGTAFPPGQLQLLRRYNHSGKIYLSYDSDGAGVRAALRAIPILNRAGFNVKVINMRPYKDPDEFIKALGTEEYENRIKHAEDSFIYILRMHQELNYDLSDPKSRSNFYKECARKIAEIPDALERGVYTETVAATFNIPKDQLEMEVRELAKLGALTPPEDSDFDAYDDKPVNVVLQQSKPDTLKSPGLRSQALILSWLYAQPAIWEKAKKFLTADDFDEGIYREVAADIIAALGEGRAIDAGAISAKYIEPEQAEVVAGIFSASLGVGEEVAAGSSFKKNLEDMKKHQMERIAKEGGSVMQIRQQIASIMKADI